jgi:hypothetical protein
MRGSFVFGDEGVGEVEDYCDINPGCQSFFSGQSIWQVFDTKTCFVKL